MDASRVMSGTWGQVWVDGELYAEVTAFQAKITKNKTEISQCGQMMTDSKVLSVKGTGSLTLNKVYSRFAGDGDAALKGHDSRYTFVGALSDPDAFGCERVSLSGVSLDEETVMDWSANSAGTITVPFTFTGRTWLDKVEA